jgi:hypothetical protein
VLLWAGYSLINLDVPKVFWSVDITKTLYNPAVQLDTSIVFKLLAFSEVKTTCPNAFETIILFPASPKFEMFKIEDTGFGYNEI